MGIKLKAKINGEWVEILTDNSDNNTNGTPQITNTSTKKYGDSINKPFDFQGKKIGWYGDSIVAGYSSPNLVVIEDGFVKLFSEKAGATFANHGVGGATISAPNGLSSSTLSWHLNGGAKADEDIVMIAAGVNDHAQKVPLGSYDSTDYANFYGGLRHICEALKTKNPDTPVIFITPINRTTSVSGEVATLDDYRNAIFEVATAYGHSVVDGSSLGLPSVSGSAGSWEYFMNADGVHPTAEGHKLYARSLCGKLL